MPTPTTASSTPTSAASPDRFGGTAPSLTIPGPRGTEIRVTDPDTGAQKGSKPERFDLIPVPALEDLARVYGMGAEKYDDHNWRKGYNWSLSYAALQRHLSAFWRGESLDPESGLPHLAHAAWHCFTLMTFMKEHPEKDDRYGDV